MTHGDEHSVGIGEKLTRLAPATGYVIGQIILVGYWAHVVSKYGVDPTSDENPYALGNFIVMVVLTGLPAALLGVFDAVARLSKYSLLRMLDALLIILLALLWIVPVTSFMLFLEPAFSAT